MPSTPGAVASYQDFPDGHRPLPAHPNLEYERKRAKKLLRELRRTKPEAKLADAQFAAAREYGFSSWPRLVAYFETSERHEVSAPPPAWYPLPVFEQMAQGLMKRLERKQAPLGAALAMFIPRFYGMRPAVALKEPVTIDDARHVVARQNRLPSWPALIEFANSRESDHLDWAYYESPREQAFRAIRNGSAAALTSVIEEQPEILEPHGRLDVMPATLLHSAVLSEFRGEVANAREITDTLVAHGADLQGALNRMLVNFLPMGIPVSRSRTGADYVEFLVARGADPSWVAPNGISVLEHFLVRAMSADVVDVIARHVTPRKALWIAAGLGDVVSLQSYFDRHGTLTPAARRHRPDFTAIGPMSIPSLPDDDDTDIMWEAFYVAAMNLRTATMDALLNHGLPIDHAPWSGATLLSLAIGNRKARLVEYLLGRGAQFGTSDADLKQLDDWMLSRDPTNADTRRIYELCGGKNADAVIRRHAETRATPPELRQSLDVVLARASQDAAGAGLTEIRSENLFVALLRDEKHLALSVLNAGNVDLAALRQSLGARLTLDDARDGSHAQPLAEGESAASADVLPMGADAGAFIESARMRARGNPGVHPYHLLAVLLDQDTGPVADMLSRAGGNLAKVRELAARF